MVKTAAAAVLLLCTMSMSLAAWTTVQPQMGTIIFGLDATTPTAGVVAGMVNGPGNVVYEYTESGETLRPLLFGTAQGQPFMMMSVQSQTINNTVASGIGYGRAFPAVMYTLDDGATWLPSSTHEEIWGLYQDGTRTISNDAYVVTGDWIVYCNTPPCPYGSGAGFSVDGGNVWTMSSPDAWTFDAWARYSSFFNTSVGFVSGGYWPLEKDSRDVILGDENEEGGLYSLSQHVAVRMDMRGASSRHEMAAKMGRATRAGYHAFIAKTTDGGASYTPVFSVHESEYYFNQIQFISNSVGLVVGEGERVVILRTADGGATWTEVFTSQYSLVALRMVNELEGWAGGAVYGLSIRSYLVHTVDGGLTWTEYPSSEIPYSIWNIDGLVASNVFAVAFNQATTALLRYNN